MIRRRIGEKKLSSSINFFCRSASASAHAFFPPLPLSLPFSHQAVEPPGREAFPGSPVVGQRDDG
jgi:hypothetical protein